MKSVFFNDETIHKLNESLSKDDVKVRKGSGNEKLSYIAAYHAINEANRLFGFGNWSTEIMHIHQVDKTEYEKSPYNAGDVAKPMISISYSCHLKLIISNGERTACHEDIGFGNGVAGNTAYGIGSCIELASKEAVTDALKRCLRYYGNKFGLSLYDKDDIPMELLEIERARIVTTEQLARLRTLYEARDIDDQWCMSALKAQGYPHDTLDEMRFDWFEMILQVAHDYRFEELERDAYEIDIEKVTELLKKSGNMSMLKALFQEAWNKTKRHGDKDRQMNIKKIYDELKAQLEGEQPESKQPEDE